MYDMGSRLKEMRNIRGLTQQDLAYRIHKSKATVSSYESNRQIPPTDVLVSISQVLNVPIAYFVDWQSDCDISTQGLTIPQREFLELLFQEFATPTYANGDFSSRQVQIIRKLFQLFASE